MQINPLRQPKKICSTKLIVTKCTNQIFMSHYINVVSTIILQIIPIIYIEPRRREEKKEKKTDQKIRETKTFPASRTRTTKQVKKILWSPQNIIDNLQRN